MKKTKKRKVATKKTKKRADENVRASDKEIANAVTRKIKPQFPCHQPEGALMFAIVENAIKDLVSVGDANQSTAKHYLNGRMIHAEICGISADWIRRVLKEANLSIAYHS